MKKRNLTSMPLMSCPDDYLPNQGRVDYVFTALSAQFLLLFILLVSGTLAIGQTGDASIFDHGGTAHDESQLNIADRTNLADEPAASSHDDFLREMNSQLGRWIWDTTTRNRQTVRFWKAFTIPALPKVVNATMLISADNGYALFLDGKTIGGGSDWRTLKVYDMTQLLTPGHHVLAVQAYNSNLQAGVIFGLTIYFKDHSKMTLVSGDDWLVTPLTNADWAGSKLDVTICYPAHVLDTGAYADAWRTNWPYGVVMAPLLQPTQMRFWQRGWFQLTLIIICLMTIGYSIVQMFQLSTQAKARNLLQIERARIAQDIHDDLGAQLTEVVLLAEVAQRENSQSLAASAHFALICARVREVVAAMNEVVWAVNSRRDTVHDFVVYVCKYAQLFFSATSIRCRLDVEPVDIPSMPFDLPVRRNLFLAVKEALHNAAKHSQADELFLRIHCYDTRLIVSVEDNGCGFDPGYFASERNGMSNMKQRMAEIGGTFDISSQPGAGCQAVFNVALKEERRHWFWCRTHQRHESESNRNR